MRTLAIALLLVGCSSREQEVAIPCASLYQDALAHSECMKTEYADLYAAHLRQDYCCECDRKPVSCR